MSICRKSLITAAMLLIISIILSSPVKAAGASENLSELLIPTLNGLAGKPIPGTSPVEYYPSSLKSAYKPTETMVSDTNNLPVNTIVKYEIKEVKKYYDPMTGIEVPSADREPGGTYREVVTKEEVAHYYKVSLTQTEYGDKKATNAKPLYFKWTEVDGKKVLTQDG